MVMYMNTHDETNFNMNNKPNNKSNNKPKRRSRPKTTDLATRQEDIEERKTSAKKIETHDKSQPFSDVLLSIRKNLKTWVFFALAVWIVAQENVLRGFITFGVMLFLVYWVHSESHSVRNFFTISHHYHHENNNWLSHGIQILMELQFGMVFPLVNELLLNDIFDKWIIIMLYIFYTSVHNINYSILHINRTHELHHAHIFTNLGPDICDIIFQSKDQSNVGDDGYIEDTSHYIPNIIVGTICVMILKHIYSNPIYKVVLDMLSYFVLAVITLIILCTNTYLMFNYA